MIIIILIINSCGKHENRSFYHLECARELIVETSIYTYTLTAISRWNISNLFDIKKESRRLDNDVLSRRDSVFRFIAFH